MQSGHAGSGHRERTAAQAKRYGISDSQLARILERRPSSKCASSAKQLGVRAVFKRVDTCAAEFESFTPYLYSTYEARVRSRSGRRARKS